MFYKSIIKIILVIAFLIIMSFAQNTDESNNSLNSYYVGFNFGKSYIQEMYSDEDIFNIGLFVAKQNWPHLFRLVYNNNFEFSIGESKSSTGFISQISEYSFIYNYLIQIPKFKKLYLGIGTGIGLIEVTKNIGYESYTDESPAITNSVIKAGLPIEMRFGFLYPDKRMRLLNFIYFFNINSIENFSGWKLNFNIKL